jgi:selenide,water dikinase
LKRLLLLGGGHAHVQVLDAWARAPLPGVALCLVTPYARQMYSGMVPGLVAGHYAAAQCAVPLPALAAAAGARLRLDAAVALDAAAMRVTLASGEVLDYDWLSIDTGPVMDREAIPGAREHALFVRPIEDFVARLDARLQPAARRAMDVAVIGAGAAGVELAMALAWRLRHVGNGASRVSLLTGDGPPLPGFVPPVLRRCARALDRLGVAVRSQRCERIAADHLQLGHGERLPCDVPLLAIGASAPAWLAGSGLALDAHGFITTGPTLQSCSHAEVFAVGDVATRVDAPHPKSGVYAVRAGPPLAANLHSALQGGPLQTYAPQRRTLYLLSCGERRAVASWGSWAAEGAWVWSWKDRIDRAFVARYTRAP